MLPACKLSEKSMLSENDKINLFGGKNCICKYFAKREALKDLDLLIAEADEILASYPPVQFGNEFETAQMYTNLLAKETQWSAKADNALWKIFGKQASEIGQKFELTIVYNPLHAYAGVRSTLEQKRHILIEFREDIRLL